MAGTTPSALSISSRALPRGWAIAWVEVSIRESITTPEGFDFRPNLLATTSFDGSIATTFKRTVTATVCDNTRELALAETGQAYKVRHSQARLGEARQALAMIHTLADDFAHEVAQLCATPVSPGQWSAFLDHHVPLRDAKDKPLADRSLTLAQNKRATLERLYAHDDRVAPWAGTAHGVLQAVNTYEHQESTIRGASRSERSMLRTIIGDFGTLDRTTLNTLNTVLAA